ERSNHSGDLHAAGDLLELCFHGLLSPLEARVDSRDDAVESELDAFALQELWIDLHLGELTRIRDNDLYLVAHRRGDDLLVGELLLRLLDLALKTRRLAHELVHSTAKLAHSLAPLRRTHVVPIGGELHVLQLRSENLLGVADERMVLHRRARLDLHL